MRPQFDVDLEFFDGFASLDGFELLDGFNSTASSDLNFDSFAGLCDLRSMVSRVSQVYATSLSMDDHDLTRFLLQFSIFQNFEKFADSWIVTRSWGFHGAVFRGSAIY